MNGDSLDFLLDSIGTGNAKGFKVPDALAEPVQAELYVTLVTCKHCRNKWHETRDLLVRMRSGRETFFAAREKVAALMSPDLPRSVIHTKDSVEWCHSCFQQKD